jgi:orotate phosphoribosyltransferase
MNNSEILKLFEDSGALLHGHFKLTSGRHSDVYYEKFKLLKNPQICTVICQKIAENFKGKGVQTVVGPTLGGVIIAYEVARYLEIQAVYAEAGESGRTLKRGFELNSGENVLIVDDVLTTGRSVNEVIELVNSWGANISGIGLMLNRSGDQTKFDYPLYSVGSIEASSWLPEDCPMCKNDEPLTQRGSRVHPESKS